MFSVGVETNVLNCKALYPCTTYYDIIKPISTNGAINQFFLGDSHGGVCNAVNRPTRIEDQDYLRTQPCAPPTSPSITLTHHRNTRTNRRPAAGLWWLCVHHRHAVAPHRHGCHLGFVLRQTERSASCWASPPRCCVGVVVLNALLINSSFVQSIYIQPGAFAFSSTTKIIRVSG